jgi:hypothetical protein
MREWTNPAFDLGFIGSGMKRYLANFHPPRWRCYGVETDYGRAINVSDIAACLVNIRAWLIYETSNDGEAELDRAQDKEE